MRPALAVALAALVLLAGCGGLAGSGPDCATATTASPTPRAEPPVLVSIVNEELATRNVSISVVHRVGGNRTTLFDSSVVVSPRNDLSTRTRFPSRNGSYRVRASVAGASDTARLTVPAGRLRYVRVRILNDGTEAGNVVSIRHRTRTPTPAC